MNKLKYLLGLISIVLLSSFMPAKEKKDKAHFFHFFFRIFCFGRSGIPAFFRFGSFGFPGVSLRSTWVAEPERP